MTYSFRQLFCVFLTYSTPNSISQLIKNQYKCVRLIKKRHLLGGQTIKQNLVNMKLEQWEEPNVAKKIKVFLLPVEQVTAFSSFIIIINHPLLKYEQI